MLARFELKSVTVSRRKRETERIKFSVNDLTFTAICTFQSEKDFLDHFLSGEKILCRYYFESTVAETDELKQCLLCYEDGIVMIVVI